MQLFCAIPVTMMPFSINVAIYAIDKNTFSKALLVIQSNLYKMTTFGTTQKWSSWKGGCLVKNYIKQPRTKFDHFWQVLVFFSAVNVLKEVKVYLNKGLQFCMFWSHSRRLKMFSVTFDFECPYIKEVQYNPSAHGSAHLFIIAISHHSHKEGKEPQFFFSV